MTTSSKTSTRLTDQAKRWVTQSLQRDHNQTREHVIWDVAVAVFPDPAATDPLTGSLADPSAVVPLPSIVIYLEIPGAEPDTSVYISPIIAPYGLTSATVDTVVNRALKTMRETRQVLLDAAKLEE